MHPTEHTSPETEVNPEIVRLSPNNDAQRYIIYSRSHDTTPISQERISTPHSHSTLPSPITPISPSGIETFSRNDAQSVQRR